MAPKETRRSFLGWLRGPALLVYDKQNGTFFRRPIREGVFDFPWGLQLTGFIAALAWSGMLIYYAFDPSWKGFHPWMLLSGLCLAALTTYCGIKTNWNRESASAPRLVKAGAGTAIIAGLAPIATITAFVVLSVVLGIALTVLSLYLVFGIFSFLLSQN